MSLVSEYTTKMKGLAGSTQAEAGLFAGLTGMFLSDVIPTPADAFYFWGESKIAAMQTAGQLTSREYWALKAGNYYIPNALWWLAVIGVSLHYGKKFDDTAKIAAGLIGTGAVVGMLYHLTKEG
jgi:hypothetical protein